MFKVVSNTLGTQERLQIPDVMIRMGFNNVRLPGSTLLLAGFNLER